MTCIVLTGIFFVLGAFLVLIIASRTRRCQEGEACVTVVFLVLAAVGLVFIGFATGAVLNYQANLKRVSRDLGVAEERFKEVSKTIESYAVKYPLEQALLENLASDWKPLLKLPEIKSDSFLMSQIEMAVKYQDAIYNLKMEGNKIKKCLDFHDNRWFSPTLADPSYESETGIRREG